jgi:hypothetical protein
MIKEQSLIILNPNIKKIRAFKFHHLSVLLIGEYNYYKGSSLKKSFIAISVSVWGTRS